MDVTAAIPLVGPTASGSDAAEDLHGETTSAFASLLLGLVSPVPLVAPSGGSAAGGTVSLEAPPRAQGQGAETALDLVLPAPTESSEGPAEPGPATGQAPDDAADPAALPGLDEAAQTAPPAPAGAAPSTLAAGVAEPAPPAAEHQRGPGKVAAGPGPAPAASTAAAPPPASAAQVGPETDAAMAPPAAAGEVDLASAAPRSDAAAATSVGAPSSAGADAIASAPSAAPATGTERSVAAQVVHHVSTLRHQADGTYELSLELEPAELGRVRVSVTLDGGVLHVQVGADADHTHELLRRALPDLRTALADAGLSTGHVDVGGHLDRRAGGHFAPNAPEDDRRGERAAARPAPTTRHRLDATTGGVDVLL